MSKLNQENLEAAIAKMLKYSLETKKRNFLETVEMQISLKNYDPAKDKRFSGNIKLANAPKEKFSVMVLANAKHYDECQEKGIPCMSKQDMEKLKKNKKLVKKLAQSHDAFLASSDLVRQIPRLLGPGLNRAGKFPTVLSGSDNIEDKIAELAATIKFQLKSKKTTCLAVPVANVGHSAEDIAFNINMSIMFFTTLLKKGWHNVRRIHLKTTMGPAHRVFGF